MLAASGIDQSMQCFLAYQGCLRPTSDPQLCQHLHCSFGEVLAWQSTKAVLSEADAHATAVGDSEPFFASWRHASAGICDTAHNNIQKFRDHMRCRMKSVYSGSSPVN